MPFVIRYPKEIPAGKRLDDIILNIDFPALFADYAGIATPNSMQGKSFRKNLTGNTPKNWRTSAYYRYWQHYPERPAHFGIRNSKYKLAFFYGQSLDMTGCSDKTTEPAWEFYDMVKDPNENHNAYNEPEYKEIILEMKIALKEQRKIAEDTDANYPVMQEIFNKSWD